MYQKKRINVILFLILTQFSLHAITENQARIGAVGIGFLGVSAAAMSKTENPTIIFTTGAAVFALGYIYLRTYTPHYKFTYAFNKFNYLKSNTFFNAVTNDHKEASSVAGSENNLSTLIYSHFPTRTDTTSTIFSYVAADNRLYDFLESVNTGILSLKTAQEDLKGYSDEINKTLWQDIQKLLLELEGCSRTLNTVKVQISNSAKFIEDRKQYMQMHAHKEQHIIQQKLAETAQQSANAQTQQANAVASKTTLAWLQALLSWACNIRSNS